MSDQNIDVLVLNTAVVDFRGKFPFADKLVGKGGLAKCSTEDMPSYSQEQMAEWISNGAATTGGFGNNAPWISKAGLDVWAFLTLGSGKYKGFDAQGEFFNDKMRKEGVKLFSSRTNYDLPTGTTFINEPEGGERGGIAYFPNANNVLNFKELDFVIKRYNPKIIYYMYSGLSEEGDARKGKALAELMDDCNKKGIITIADSHTLTGDVKGVIDSGKHVKEYELLKPLLPKLDLFFTSSDEAKMIANTFGFNSFYPAISKQKEKFLEDLTRWTDYVSNPSKKNTRTRIFGITVKDGVYATLYTSEGGWTEPFKVESKFLNNQNVDLVGAGDTFRAGVLTYLAKNIEDFKKGKVHNSPMQMGNLFAALHVNSPLQDRTCYARPYNTMLEIVNSGKRYSTIEGLQKDLNK